MILTQNASSDGTALNIRVVDVWPPPWTVNRTRSKLYGPGPSHATIDPFRSYALGVVGLATMPGGA